MFYIIFIEFNERLIHHKYLHTYLHICYIE